MDELKEKALEYHSRGGVPGKVSVVPTKPCVTADDLSLAYTPGVAKPVLEIADNPANAFKYTSKGNLVAVISNGTAILGLGDRGALASKPVMEGKGVLFKRFADIDVFDIELNEKDPKKIIEIVKAMEPTFGGVNLEDIKAPECFEIEQTLIKECSIPIMHDDQHGTAIICTAGIINAAERHHLYCGNHQRGRGGRKTALRVEVRFQRSRCSRSFVCENVYRCRC